MVIYLDFDGTVVEHQYPKIGRCNFGAIEVIKKLQDAGHSFKLNTYRSSAHDGTLEAALNYINKNYWMLLRDKSQMDTFVMQPITEYTLHKLSPPTWNWENIKRDQEMYIDDQAAQIPTKKAAMTNGLMVDWDELDKQFVENGIYTAVVENQK